MIIVSRYSRTHGIKKLSEKRATSKELWEAFKPAILPLCLPIIIIGGIRLGFFTPTEAGAIAIFYALISLCKNKYIFMLLVNIFLLIVGMFIEATAAQIVLAPMLAPVAAAFGIDPVQFGMVFIFNMAIGSLTPPMGNLMFVTCSVTKCKTEEFIRDCLGFYILLFIVLLLMSYVPMLSTWLPNLVYGA